MEVVVAVPFGVPLFCFPACVTADQREKNKEKEVGCGEAAVGASEREREIAV